MREGRTTNAIQLISHGGSLEGRRKEYISQGQYCGGSMFHSIYISQNLGIVNRAAITLLAGGFLHFVEMLFHIFQLSLHPFNLLLLLFLVLVPCHTVGYAVGGSKTDGLVEIIDLALHGSNLIFLRQNLRLPLFGWLFGTFRRSGRLRRPLSAQHRPGSHY